MKKYLSVFCLIVFLIILTGCNSKPNEKEVKVENTFKIVKYNFSETSPFGISGEGADYIIKSLKNSNYEVSFYSKEYEDGKFVEEHKIHNSTLDSNNKELSIGIYQESKIVRFFIDPSSIASVHKDVTLDFFNDSTKAIVLSSLEKEKEFPLDAEVPIAVFSSSNNDPISSVDIGGGYNPSLNQKDLVVFMKCELKN
ncbi:hypothetical protein [Paraclostridium bifermentans]|uniref:hypothetical protein n=1 Tax=Paraclostridium bifermentans TaxID=1490 RepID=UPI00290B4445|nr:hypothetical protein [Paraclostridium bifermentans]MDU3337912.1 hypothetical protein [Paraclostridium bifermentans]